MDDWIAENLKECTVRLQGVDGELGTGFFVAPGLVLTCFHVVKTTYSQKQIILAEWQNQQFNASVEALPSNPEIVDLALLKLENAPHTHLWVTLDVNPAIGDELYTFGYTRDYLNGEPATFECEGFDGDNPPLMKFKAGQVRSGLSGSAIINQKTGKVCGIVKRSRDVDFDLGGRAVPISVVLATFPTLSQQQPTISINNPFLPLNGRVEEPELFFGREKECDRIFETLNSGSSVAIIGERGVGKSSLLLAVKRHAETRLIQPRKAVYINLNQIYDEKDFYEALCYEVGIKTCKGYALTRALQQQRDRILLILDEIERMTWEGFTRQVREQLRGLAEGGDAPLRMVIAASTSLNQLFPDSHGMTSPFQGICIEETISRWDDGDMRLLINKRLQLTPIRFKEEEIVQIINTSRGHPRELMQMCNRIYNQYRGK
jgi:hypothetical protein